MSGAEGAGIALALLPIISSTWGRFNEYYRPIVRYQSLSKDINQFRHRFDVEKASFHAQCLKLLGSCIEYDNAVSMLLDDGHPLWSDRRLAKMLDEQLGEQARICTESVKMIEDLLTEIIESCRKLWDALDHDAKKITQSSSLAVWKDRFTLKIRHGWSRDKMNGSLRMLGDLNTRFEKISNHMCSFQAHRSEQKSEDVEARIPRTFDYSLVNGASSQIYYALSAACREHFDHHALVNVEVEHGYMIKQKEAFVKFRIAFQRTTEEEGADGRGPLWFVIEFHQLGRIQESRKIISLRSEICEKLSDSLQKTLATSSRASAERLSNFDRLASSEEISARAIQNEIKTHKEEPRTEIQGNMCDLIRINFQKACKESVCLGFLINDEQSNLVVHMTPADLQKTQCQPVILTDLLENKGEISGAIRLPLLDRLSWAKRLSMAVLQFYKTPWLSSFWSSNDVCLLKSADSHSPSLWPVHLRARIYDGESGEDEDGPALTSQEKASTDVLVSLGIVLLELAHGVSMTNLCADSRSGKAKDGRSALISKARVVSESGRSDLGPKYQKIVKSLLTEDGGAYVNLANPETHASFHKNVVYELDHLERGLQKLLDWERS